ncbi:FliM/FliN family flagellar motor switch protein [Shewanella sp. UCD-KL12]|uniref:FliM/FliN family flagellar motor switch protein n=1 Tax=Shewanella sp. UCD-KL12 TaxID=1917163 RepID=UPI0009705702|nr:flagellar motor switch protein FliM [Shewanella sp. UCD-KL12]
MKTTAKAKLLKFSQCKKIRPVALIQEKLARSRLLIQVESCQRAVLDSVNSVLNPIIRQGHHGLTDISLQEVSVPIEPDGHNAWFRLSYHGAVMAWWRIDRCTLDQLASGYYGSLATPFKSPLRSPSQSEFRLARKLMLSALKVLPISELDEEAIELELVANNTPIDAPINWSLSFAKGQMTPPIQFCMTEYLLGLMSEQPSFYQATAGLSEKLAQRLKQIPLKVSLELGRQTTPVTSLNGLKAGDILPMNLHSRCPVTVGKRPLFYAAIHTHEGQMVAKLTQDIFQQDDGDNS